jgi:putative redox protein
VGPPCSRSTFATSTALLPGTAEGASSGDPAVSAGVSYTVEVEGEASDEALCELVRLVDEIAEIPNSLRRGTEVRLSHVTVQSSVDR